MEVFEASVQYDDFTGTVAADRSDTVDLLVDLRKDGLANPDERIVGYRIGMNENAGHNIDEMGLVVYLRGGTFDEPAPIIRAIDITFPTAKFFSLFKRFDLVLTQAGMNLKGVEVDGPHYG